MTQEKDAVLDGGPGATGAVTRRSDGGGGCDRLESLLAACPDAVGAGVRCEGRDEEALAAVRQHVAGCGACRAGLDDLETVDRLLVGAFRWLESDLRPQRAAILARLGEGAPVTALEGAPSEGVGSGRAARASGRQRTARPLSGRSRSSSPRRLGWFFALHAVAALALFSGYLGYLSLLRLERSNLARLTRMDVRNVALAMQSRALKQGRELPPESRSALLLALGIREPNRSEPARTGLPAGRVENGQLLDAFGRALVYERKAPREARIYSLGPNGRDEQGEGDDIVALVTLPQR